jgi:hypothetical protein
MQRRQGYKGMVITPESPAAWEEGRQLNWPTTVKTDRCADATGYGE